MYLANALLRELETSDLSINDRALLICRISKQFEAGGDYDAAQNAMSEFWQGIGVRPDLEGLSEEAGAEVLLRVGKLTGLIGSTSRIEGSQEAAKDFISESLRTFERLGRKDKVAEAHNDLAVCYWRAGALDEARITLQEALAELCPTDTELRASILLSMAEVERSSKRLSESLRIYAEVAPLFNGVPDILLIAHFHHGYANVLNQLGTLENNREYQDRALMEYTAAGIHFEAAGHDRYQACVENNLGVLYGSIGRFNEAHEHLDRAQVLFTRTGDSLRLAQSDEARARVLLAEGKLVEAEKIARSAMAALGQGEQASWFAEALITHGVTLARLDHFSEAQISFQQAMNVAEQAGDFESAGLAALTFVEEVKDLPPDVIYKTLERTRTLLNKIDDANTLKRLAKAAFRGLFEFQKTSLPASWEGFELRKAVHDYESNLIALALRDSDGAVTKAAHLLGFKHHQSLAALISGRHPELLEVRRPLRPRRKHFMPHANRKKKH
jgi:tetratricopeptide (TPR) repeat protein